MPYSAPKSSSVQWQAQTRKRNAPHSPTLRPRTTAPESVEDLSFPETGSLSLAPAAAPPTPDSFPTIVTALPAFKPPPEPTAQNPQTPNPPKLPVSNASAAKARMTKDRLPISSPSVSSEPQEPGPEPRSTSVFVTSEVPVRKHKPRDSSRLTNGVEKLATNRVEGAETNKVEKTMVNGINKPLVNGHQAERVASPAPQLWPPSGVEIPALPPQPAEPQPSQPPQASYNSDGQDDYSRSAPENPVKTAPEGPAKTVPEDPAKTAPEGPAKTAPEGPAKTVILASSTPNSAQVLAEGVRKGSVIKGFLVRILSSCGRGRPTNGQ